MHNAMRNVPLTKPWKFKHKTREREIEGVASTYCSQARAACRGLAILRHAGKDFLQKRKICVTDEIVLMGTACR